MAKVKLVLDVDPELADEGDSTGLTEKAYDRLMEVLTEFGTVDEGPDLVG